MTSFAACTIVAHNYLPMARVLASSFLDHHPEATFYVVVVDRPVEARLIRGECFRVIPITDVDLGPEGHSYMATIYDVTEFATSIKPFVLRGLLQDHECVFYIDPDIKLYDRLDPLVAATMEAGWSLTPHCLEPIPLDGSSPTSREIMQSGVYNLGFIGVARTARPFLDWWCERLRRHAIIDPENQLFTDQRWIDLAVPIFAPHIERSKSYNVAYWNIDQRDLHLHNGTLMVGDEPLRFFHFSGYDPENPHWLSKYFPGEPRVLLSENRVLADLCNAYGDELVEQRAKFGHGHAYGWSDAFPGVPLWRSLRRLFRTELMDAEAAGEPWPPSPFDSGGSERFREWLTAVPPHSLRGLPRYLDSIYDDRGDVQAVYPEVERGEFDGYYRWLLLHGVAEHPIIDTLGVPAQPGDADFASDALTPDDGIDVIGYLRAESGVGEAGRLASSALLAAGVSVSTVAVPTRVNRQSHPFLADGEGLHDIALMAVNADQARHVRRSLGPAFLRDRYVIGQWFWEIDEFPPALHHAFELVDEVWAPTRHILGALSRVAPEGFEVLHMPLPLVAPLVTPGLDKSYFGLPADRFAFLFTFDLNSVFERKNPLALVDAFRRAFAPDEGPVLAIKAFNGRRHLKSLERLRWACKDRSDVVILDQYLDHGVAGALTQACDCYVSLHRSEGLGLTMAEAMALGKPVIATAYSGNLDFMTDDNSLLVPWSPVLVGKNADPYPAAATWAEPDVDAAAAAMRKVADDRSFATSLGSTARQYIETNFNPTVTGERMKQRLDTIRRNRHV